MSKRQYIAYCLAVSIVLIAVKIWIGTHVQSTAFFDDDHEYLNRSVYVLEGNVELVDYPFTKKPYGPLYPLVVSPWILFADPSTRLAVVFAINALLSAVAVFFGSLTVYRLTSTSSLLVPLCLAAFGPLFQVSFYAMSENLIFPLLAVVGWLLVDFEHTCKTPFKLISLLLLLLMLPLVRAPGLAVLPAMFLLLWFNRQRLFQGRAVPLAVGLAILLPMVSYYGFYRVTVDSQREAEYLQYIWDVLSNSDRWLYAVKLTFSQTGYVFLSTGYWVLPLFVVVALQLRTSCGERSDHRWLNYFTYAGVSAAVFVCFTLVHLFHKLKFQHPEFFYGRYNDPAGFLVLIGSLAGILILRPLTIPQGLLLRAVAPLALGWTLAHVAGGNWPPVNQSGLAIFALEAPPARHVVMVLVLATLLNQLADTRRRYVPLALLFFLTFSVLTDHNGIRYTIDRAKRGAHSLEAADWIAENVPTDARIGYDGRVLWEDAPAGIKKMHNVYRAMMFRTYPRRTVLVQSEKQLGTVDYLYTTVWPNEGMVTVWTNGDYSLHRMSKAYRPDGVP